MAESHPIEVRLRVVLLACAVVSIACSSGECPADHEARRVHGLMPPTLNCTTSRSDSGEVHVRYTVRNVGSKPIYLLDGDRMPYLLADGDNVLEILDGVHPRPHPEFIYEIVEVP